MELKRKGQAFILSAIIITTIILLVAVNLNFSSVHTEQPTIQNYFDQQIEQAPVFFNQALVENKTGSSVKKDMYTYNSFVERDAQARGIDYSAINLFVLPEKQKYVLINYESTETELTIIGEGEVLEEDVLEPYQWLKNDFNSDKNEFELQLTDKGISKEFTAFTPRIFVLIDMESSQERWVNYYVA